MEMNDRDEKAVRQYWPTFPLENVHKDLKKLSEQIEQADEFAPQNISNFWFPTASHCYYLLNNIAPTTPVQVNK